MKLHTLTYLVAALSATVVLAEDAQPLQPTETCSPDNYTQSEHQVALQEYLEHGNNREGSLERRQGLNLNGAAVTAATQAGATTTFYMASAIGTTDTYVAYTYVQTFAAVPDQWPLPNAGEIGYGTLKKQNKREAAPTPAGLKNGQPLILELRNVIVTQPVKPVMEVTEAVEIPPGWTTANGNPVPINATLGMNATATSSANMTAIGNMTALANSTSTHSVRIIPSQMNPEFMHTRLPLTTAP